MIRLTFPEAVAITDRLGRKKDLLHSINNAPKGADGLGGFRLDWHPLGWLITHPDAADGVCKHVMATFVPHNRCTVEGSEAELRALYGIDAPEQPKLRAAARAT